MKNLLTLSFVLIFLMGFGSNAQSEPITLGFEGSNLVGLAQGTNLVGVSIPAADPYAGIVTFENAILGYYGGTAVGWTGVPPLLPPTYDNVSMVGGGTRTLADFAYTLTYAAYPNPVPNAFITDKLGSTGPGSESYVVAFNFAIPVTNVSFYVTDIDGQVVGPAIRERFTARIIGDGFVQEIVIDAGQPNTGDDYASYVAFNNATGITRLETLFTRAGTDGILGTADDVKAGGGGIDYLSFQPIDAVPEPATMLLLGSGLIGFGVFVRRKFKK